MAGSAAGSQADILASQAEALIRELRGKNAAAAASLAQPAAAALAGGSPHRTGSPLPVVPPLPAPIPSASPAFHPAVAPPTSAAAAEAYTGNYETANRMLAIRAAEAEEAAAMATADRAAAEAREIATATHAAMAAHENTLPLLDAQKKIEQLLMQLDISMQSQKTLSVRLDETRRRAEDAEMRAEAAHKLQQDNELLSQQLSCLVNASNGNKNAVDLLTKEKYEMLVSIKELQAELARERDHFGRRLEDELANLRAEMEERVGAALREKADVEAQNEALTGRAAARDAEAERLKARIAALEEEVEASARELDAARGKNGEYVQNMRRECERTVQELRAELSKQAQDHDAALRAVSRELNDTQAALREAEATGGDLQRRLEEAQRRLEEALAGSSRAAEAYKLKIESEMEVLMTQITGLKDNEMELRSQKAALERELALSKSEINRLTLLVETLEKRLKHEQELSDRRLKEAQDAADVMRDQLHEQINNLHKAKANNLQDQDALIAELQKRLADAMKGKQQADATAQSAKAEFEKKLHDLKVAHELAMANLRHEHTLRANGEMDELRLRHEGELSSVKMEAEKAIGDYRLRNEKLQGELVAAEGQAQSLRHQIDLLTIELRALEQREASLRASMRQGHKEHNTVGCQAIDEGIARGVQVEAETTAKVCQADLPDVKLETELRVHREALERLKKQIADESKLKAKQLDELERERRSAVDEAREKDKLAQGLQADKAALEAEVDELRQALDQLRKDSQGVEALRAELQYNAEMMKMKEKQLQNLMGELQEKDNDIEAQRKVIDGLKRDLRELDSLKGELDGMKGAGEGLRGRLAKLSADVAERDDKIQELLEELRELRLSHENLTRDLEACRAQPREIAAPPVAPAPAPAPQYDYCNPCQPGYSPDGLAHDSYCDPNVSRDYYARMNRPHVEVEVVSEQPPRVEHTYLEAPPAAHPQTALVNHNSHVNHTPQYSGGMNSYYQRRMG